LSSQNICGQSSSQDITIGQFGTTASDLSLKLSDAVDQIKLSSTTVEGVWKKAASLVVEVNAIVPAPGFDAKDKMVKSKSGAAPHSVRVSEYKYKCDDHQQYSRLVADSTRTYTRGISTRTCGSSISASSGIH